MQNYDIDVLSGDLIFTPDGDVKALFDPELVSQDIKREIETPKGSLSWDDECGSDLWLYLNNTQLDNVARNEISRVISKDDRVVTGSVDIQSVELGYAASYECQAAGSDQASVRNQFEVRLNGQSF